MKWLEKRIKAKRDEEAEQQQRMLSSESEKEEGEEEDSNNTEDLHYEKSESEHEYLADSIIVSYSEQKQMLKILDKRPARPGSSILGLLYL
jgi:hypothetical protein